ncbi:hypothetical protein BHAOGJBA_0399 [Methylobacterium hispanicum]|jgi:hypothetical protein|uniref:SRPBCC family protein n=1 Tax=Methylobacterium hispanicum TaxID=270350 RepID=A0AAV4ZEQ7_9HYPH|nr:MULTISPECIES: hypothetical protein [Methylobacterium]GJD86901.1 hypothetical protein BHAOGJBA_0399 [Methylobacterium hispanicum]
MSKSPEIVLGKIAKKIEVRDHYLSRRLEASTGHAYLTWRDPESFLHWFVPPQLTVISYEHDAKQNRLVLRDHLGNTSEYRLRYERDELNAVIQLCGGECFGDQRGGEVQSIFTVMFDELSAPCEELSEDAKVTFVQLLIRHPTVAAWYSADGCGLHELWTAAFERYVQRVEAR